MANGLTRTPQAGGITSARDFFDRFFEDPFGTRLPSLFGQEGVTAQVWAPRVDIAETEDAYRFEVEVPGLKREDVNATIEKNVLTFTGERKFEKEDKKENYHRIERAYGKFTRSFTLPNNVDAEKAKAEFKDGVLTVTVPKSEAQKPRKINIA